jgi:hypothetical protein
MHAGHVDLFAEQGHAHKAVGRYERGRRFGQLCGRRGTATVTVTKDIVNDRIDISLGAVSVHDGDDHGEGSRVLQVPRRRVVGR